MTITFVTGNTKKFHEVRSALDQGIVFVQENIDLIEPQRLSLWDVSAHKAKHAFELLKKPVLVDDTGIFFDAYTHFPGVFTKFIYEQIGFEGLEKLTKNNNNAKFVTILSYMDETLDQPLQFVGEVNGQIVFDRLHQQEVDHHMPYNSIFMPAGFDQPVSLCYSEWLTINHRVRASKQFSDWIISRV